MHSRRPVVRVAVQNASSAELPICATSRQRSSWDNAVVTDRPSGAKRSTSLPLIIGLVWVGAIAAGLASMVLAASGDGIAPEDYDAGDRFALFALFVLASAVALVGGLAAFWVAWTSRRPRRPVFSAAVALSTCAVVVAVVPSVWHR